MRNKVHVWVATGLLFGAAATRAAFTFANHADRSSSALIDWGLVALWLIVPLLAVWRQLRAPADPASQQMARDAAVRIAVAAYLPVHFTLALVGR